MRTSPLMLLTTEEKYRMAILETLEEGDQDQQPWAFYEHDHGGLRGYQWTKEQAQSERVNFVNAIAKRIKEEFSE